LPIELSTLAARTTVTVLEGFMVDRFFLCAGVLSCTATAMSFPLLLLSGLFRLSISRPLVFS
jgi:hypothetical protein